MRKIVSVVLGFLILVSSNGIVLASHVCFSKCGTEVSLFVRTGCCSKEQKDCHREAIREKTIKKKCCELKISFHQVDVSSQIVKGNHVSADYVQLRFHTPGFASVKNESGAFIFNKAPPRPSGRVLLTSISLLLI